MQSLILATAAAAIAAALQIAPVGMADAGASPCSTPSELSALAAADSPAGDASLGALALAAAPSAGTFRVTATQILSGPCATAITAFKLGNVYLADGRVVARDAAGRMSVHTRSDLAEGLLPATQSPAATGDDAFVMAYRTGYRRVGEQLVTDYVGLWRGPAGSALRSFSTSPGTGTSKPNPVLRSRLPVRSVTYFPAPDTNSGRLSLVQQMPGGQARLISIDWLPAAPPR